MVCWIALQLNDTIADAEEDDSYMMCSSMVEEDNIDSGDNVEDGTPDACPLVIARGAVETHEAEHGDYANIRVAESSNHAGLQLLMSPEGMLGLHLRNGILPYPTLPNLT